jgi:HEAT repeat protein
LAEHAALKILMFIYHAKSDWGHGAPCPSAPCLSPSSSPPEKPAMINKHIPFVSGLRKMDKNSPDSIASLIAALHNGQAAFAAAEALIKIGDSAVPALIADLRALNQAARNIFGTTPRPEMFNAAFILSQIGAPAVEAVISVLTDEKVVVRDNATYILGKIGDPRAVDTLINTLKDQDKNVRWGAAEALGQIRSVRAVDALIDALQDAEMIVRSYAIRALGQIGDARAVDPLIHALQDDAYITRSNAAYALGEIGDIRAVESLILALKDEAVSVRRGAAHSLGKIGDPRAVVPLITTLQDEERLVHGDAAFALKKIGTPEALAALSKVEK